MKKMGNVNSENRVCDCTPGSTDSTILTTREACAKTGVQTKSRKQVDKAREGGRVRSRSLGESKSLAPTGSKISPNHGYHLRSRGHTGVSDRYDKSKIVPASSSSHNMINNELLLVTSLERLTFVGSSKPIDDEKKVHSLKSSRKSSVSLNNDEEEEEIELPKHVLYYGWFFSVETSSEIHDIVMHYFRLCYTQVPQFHRFISTCCKDANARDPFEYYKRPGKRVKPDDPIEYHITAKFLGRTPDLTYQTVVHPFLLKTFWIRLVGIVFTPRTLGVRVKLSAAQQLIFDEKDDFRNGSRRKIEDNTGNDGPNEIRMIIQKEIDGYARTLKKHKKAHPNCKLKMNTFETFDCDKNVGVIFKRLHDEPCSLTTKSRAHVTIGCAPNVLAKQTGDDLVDVIDLEQRQATTSDSNFQQDFKLERGVLRQFGKHANAFVFYSDTEMIVPARYDLFI